MDGTTYRANEAVSCDDEGEDGALLYNPDNDTTKLLNGTGLKVWNFLAAPRTMSEIAGHLKSLFPSVAPERAVQDAEKFVQGLTPDFVIPSTETADADPSADSRGESSKDLSSTGPLESSTP